MLGGSKMYDPKNTKHTVKHGGGSTVTRGSFSATSTELKKDLTKSLIRNLKDVKTIWQKLRVKLQKRIRS